MKWKWNIQNQLKILLLLIYNIRGFFREKSEIAKNPEKYCFWPKKYEIEKADHFFSALMNEITWKKYNTFLKNTILPEKASDIYNKYN